MVRCQWATVPHKMRTHTHRRQGSKIKATRLPICSHDRAIEPSPRPGMHSDLWAVRCEASATPPLFQALWYSISTCILSPLLVWRFSGRLLAVSRVSLPSNVTPYSACASSASPECLGVNCPRSTPFCQHRMLTYWIGWWRSPLFLLYDYILLLDGSRILPRYEAHCSQISKWREKCCKLSFLQEFRLALRMLLCKMWFVQLLLRILAWPPDWAWCDTELSLFGGFGLGDQTSVPDLCLDLFYTGSDILKNRL